MISEEILNHFRTEYARKLLEEEKGELTKMEIEVLEHITNFETISKDVDLETEGEISTGQKLADKMAKFGGSWYFIISFAGFILVWILVNIVFWQPILLTLIHLFCSISCFFAWRQSKSLLFMMSQNRQKEKDRLRSKHDYQINLKAELEMRRLHEKIDHLSFIKVKNFLKYSKSKLHLCHSYSMIMVSIRKFNLFINFCV